MAIARTVAVLLLLAALAAGSPFHLNWDQTPFQFGAKRFDGHALLRLFPTTQHHVDTLQQWLDGGVDFWSHLHRIDHGGHVDIRLDAGQRARFSAELEDMGARPIVENIQALVDSERAEVAAQDMSTEAKSFLTSYHNYDDILVWMKELVLAHSDIATLVEVGKTYEGRTIYGVRLTPTAEPKGPFKPINIAKMHTPNTPDSESTAPLGFIFHGAQHAREWISAAVSIYLLDSLVATLSSETMPETVADLALTKFEWTVIPVMNVDGYIYTWEKDRMWRKNRQPNPSSSFFPCVGTDTNRNWDYRWNTGGSSRNPCSEAYLGPSPFSSQEPKAIADYVLSRKKAGVDVKVYIDFHAYSQLWMSPWGYTCSDDTVDENRQVAAAQKAVKALAEVNGKRFAAGPICRTIYPASGSSTDWVYGTANVTYSYGVELRDTGAHGFVLPASEILPSGKEMWAAVTALAEFVAKDANVVQ